MADSKRRIANLFVGIGAYEVMTYMLTNEENNFTKMGVPVSDDDLVQIENPLTSLTTICRNWLTPSLLEILVRSKKSPYPQRIFEIDQITHLDQSSPTFTRDEWNFCYLETGPNINYNNARAALSTLEFNFDFRLRVTAVELPYLIPGRSAEIWLGDREKIGFIGECYPQVLENLGLEFPTAGFEISLKHLMTEIRLQHL